MTKTTKWFVIDSILAGVMIGIAGTAYLMTGYAWLFPIGLFIICSYSLELFTGMVCYFFRKVFIGKLVLMYLLNTVSAYLMGILIAYAKPIVVEKTRTLAQVKLMEGWTLIPLAILCNVLIFVAVDTYRKTKKFLGLIFATTVFVACGFEHCIANAFYFGVAGVFSFEAALYLLINGLFNAVGGVLAHKYLSV